jgi:hypothetical protein
VFQDTRIKGTVSVVEMAANMAHMEAKSLAPCCRSTVRLSQP